MCCLTIQHDSRSDCWPIWPNESTTFPHHTWNLCTTSSVVTPWSRVLLEELTDSQLVNKIPTFYGTPRFNTAFTSALHLSLSWARWTQSMPSHPISWRSILILSSHRRLGVPSGLFPSGFPTKTLNQLYNARKFCTLRTQCICGFSTIRYPKKTIHFLVSQWLARAGIAPRHRPNGLGIGPGGVEGFRSRPDRPWGPSSLLYNGYRVIPGSQAAGAWRWLPINTYRWD